MKGWIAALALLLPGAAAAQQTAPAATTAPAPAPAPATVDATVYGTELAPGWQNWSWAKTELSVELGGSTRKPIRVEPGPWEALYLHHAPFSTAPFRGLGMMLHGLAAGGQEVRIIAIVDGKPVPDKMKLVKLGANGWTRVVVPLEALGADNKVIDGIWVQNATGAPLPHFYVTEIAFQP